MANVKLEDRLMGGNRRERFTEAEHAEHTGTTLLRIFRYFSDQRKRFVGILLVVIIGTVCGIYAPSAQSRAIDILSGSVTGKLWISVGWMLFAYLIYCLSQLLQGLLSAKLSQRLVQRLRSELFGEIVDLPILHLDTHSHGDLMSRMTNDIENISTTVSQSLPTILSGTLTLIGTAAAMLLYCWQLALLSMITVLLTLVATKILSGKVRKYAKQRQILLGKANGIAEEMISGYRTVVAYQHQDITVKAFCDTADTLTKAGIRTDSFSGVMGPIMNCIGNIGFVLIAVFGGIFALHGMISVGVISAFLVYSRQFSRPINELSQVYGQLQTAIAGAERVFAAIDLPVEDCQGDDLEADHDCSVTFENVTFSYVPGNPVIRNFTLTIPAKQRVALVGATGSGKTTIVNLLMRFYDPDSGTIRIGTQKTMDLSRPSLRKSMAIVLQDTVLFSDTVRNNLKYANENATDAQLQQAAALSCCRPLIESLPDGYDTVLTGGGQAISQGQRQLMSIARAFVADPEILILDEATSNVDTRTEKKIQTAMQNLMKDRTSIVIAHRLSTIQEADLIVVMDHGSIAEMGTHRDLLAKKGTYYDLYMTQFAGFAT